MLKAEEAGCGVHLLCTVFTTFLEIYSKIKHLLRKKGHGEGERVCVCVCVCWSRRAGEKAKEKKEKGKHVLYMRTTFKS